MTSKLSVISLAKKKHIHYNFAGYGTQDLLDLQVSFNAEALNTTCFESRAQAKTKIVASVEIHSSTYV